MQIDIDALAALKLFVAKQPNQRDAAAALGFSQAFLSQMLKGRRRISTATLTKLGLRRTIILDTTTRRRKTDTPEELAS